MSAPEPTLLLGTAHPEKGVFYLETVAPGVVAAITAGDGPSLNPKRDPNEDSAAIVPLPGGGVAALVADSHFGAAASEIAARGFVEEIARRGAADFGGDALPDVLERIDERIGQERPKNDGSETTALAAVVTGDTLAWAGVGDSYLFRRTAAERQLHRLGRRGMVFLGSMFTRHAFTRGDIPLDAVLDAGAIPVVPGDLVLLATDGIEREASGLTREGIEALLNEPLTLEHRIVAIMTEAGRAEWGGGRDNLSVVAIEVG